MSPRPDVVVVGGRVAGASTALLLARAGLRVLLLDRSRRGADTLSTHALMRGGVLELRRWGLLDRVVASGAPPVRRVTFCYGADPVVVTLKPDAGVDALYAPRRTVLDALVVDAAEEAGAEVRFGLAAADLARDGTGRIAGVVVRDARGRTWTERAGLVVGADGRNSLVAERALAPVVAAGACAGAYAYGYWPLAAPDGYRWHYGTALSAGVIPTNGGLACVFLGGPPETLQAAVRAGGPLAGMRRLAARLGGGLPDLTGTPPIGPVRFFRGMPSLVRQPCGPGWALVGDAGWWQDPLSTHGITAALYGADLLATAVVAGGASGRAGEAAWAGYRAARDRVALRMQPIVDRLASHAWGVAEVGTLLRRLSAVMAEEVDAIDADEPASRLTATSGRYPPARRSASCSAA